MDAPGLSVTAEGLDIRGRSRKPAHFNDEPLRLLCIAIQTQGDSRAHFPVPVRVGGAGMIRGIVCNR